MRLLSDMSIEQVTSDSRIKATPCDTMQRRATLCETQYATPCDTMQRCATLCKNCETQYATPCDNPQPCATPCVTM